RSRHTRFSRDWSSDVCSSDLPSPRRPRSAGRGAGGGGAMTRILTGTEVADLLAVDVGTVKAMTARGELPALVRVADELLISEGRSEARRVGAAAGAPAHQAQP